MEDMEVMEVVQPMEVLEPLLEAQPEHMAESELEDKPMGKRAHVFLSNINKFCAFLRGTYGGPNYASSGGSVGPGYQQQHAGVYPANPVMISSIKFFSINFFTASYFSIVPTWTLASVMIPVQAFLILQALQDSMEFRHSHRHLTLMDTNTVNPPHPSTTTEK